MDSLAKELETLAAIDAKAEALAVYEVTLAGILSEDRPIERLTSRGVRYSRAGGLAPDDMERPHSTAAILAAQREDLKMLSVKTDQALDALVSAIPLAEKGQFVPVMLSGRNAFGDVMPELTEMMSVYERLYTRTCMATIAATMQVYPAGFEWLPKPDAAK